MDQKELAKLYLDPGVVLSKSRPPSRSPLVISAILSDLSSEASAKEEAKDLLPSLTFL